MYRVSLMTRFLLVFFVLGVLMVMGINVYIVLCARPFVFHAPDAVPERYTALVLGAKAYRDGVSPALKDRLDAGARLRLDAKVQKLLLSGDHRTIRNDETNNMRRYIQRVYPAIPPADIFLDHAGFDTYDSVSRARAVFQVTGCIIVTQEFHASRAVYLARSLGIDAVALAVPESEYSLLARLYWNLRETLARVKAFGDVVFKSKPALLGSPVPIQGDGRLSWDSGE